LIVRAAAAALYALGLAGCVDSVGPILPDPQPLFGTPLRLQFYTLHKGSAQEPEQATYQWNGARYTHIGGGMRDISDFSVHPFEGDNFIVQSVAAKRPRITEYALAHKLAEGVYQVIAIDEDDADVQSRAAHCKKADDSGCRIEKREQLFAFARATAARRKGEGGLVLRLPPRRR
jgi:hypothetical protein